MIKPLPIRSGSREWALMARLRGRARFCSFVLLTTLLLQIVSGVLASADAKPVQAADLAATSFCSWQIGPQLADNESDESGDNSPAQNAAGIHCVFCTPLMNAPVVVSTAPFALSAPLPGFKAILTSARETWLADVFIWGSAAPQAPPAA